MLTIAKRRFSLDMLRSVMRTTLRITSLGFIILVGANCFGLVFRGLNGDHLVQDFLKSLPFGRYGVLALVMGVAGASQGAGSFVLLAGIGALASIVTTRAAAVVFRRIFGEDPPE